MTGESGPLMVTLTEEQRDALRAYLSEVAGIWAWIAYEGYDGPRPPATFDACFILQIDLGYVPSPSGTVTVSLTQPRDVLLSMFTGVGLRLYAEAAIPERGQLVAEACGRVLDVLEPL